MSNAAPDDDDAPENPNDNTSSEKEGTGSTSASPPSPENTTRIVEPEQQRALDVEPSVVSTKMKSEMNNRSTTPDDNQAAQVLLNRFSNWGQQAKDTAVATLFRRSNSSPSPMPGRKTSALQQPQQPANIVPLQTASLSPTKDHSTELPSPFFAKTTLETNVIEIVEEGDDDHEDSGAFQGKGGRSSTGSSSVIAEDSPFTNSRRGVTALQWAASNVLDSVQQNAYFRGRYNRENSNNESQTESMSTSATTVPSTKQTPSQITRIMSSPHASHLQTLMGKDRPPNEFVMLLGRGMLGVNLKQTYLKHQGVYVDYLVHGGSAERSGVIYVGDALLSVGSVDVRKSNIWHVPQTIASAARPVHLILSTCGTSAEVQTDRITHVDACVGLLYHYRILESNLHAPQAQDESLSTDSDGSSVEGETRRNSHDAEDDDVDDRPNDKMELISPTSFEGPDEIKNDNEIPVYIDDVKVDLLDSIAQFLNPGIPPESLRMCIRPHVAKRCNEVEYEDVKTDLAQLAADSASFRAALRNTFLICVVDCRRYPFLARHFAQIHVFGNDADTASSSDRDQLEAFSISDAMLKLFSDMLIYSFLFPLSSRNRRKEIASHIAYKYFLPTTVDKSELVPPTFDFHHIVSDKALRSLESALREPESLTNDTFVEFQRAVADSLSYETPFLSFLVSNECARMRAYLRNTAPFVNIPFHRVVKLVTSRDTDASPHERYFAKNYILYVLIYLLTLTDQESFGENDDLFEQNNAANARKAGETTGTRPKRIDDSAMSLCTHLFLESSVLSLLRQQVTQPSASSQDLKRTLGHLWEVLLAPNLSDDQNGEHYSKFTTWLGDFFKSSTDPDEILPIKEDVLDLAQNLSDELLYDYAETHHAKFQAHKFHEWLCEELIKSGVENDNLSGLVSPTLPSGCIKRLLRKVQWPNGITPHKLSLHPTFDENELGTNVRSLSSVTVQNAECAVVFGSKTGTSPDQWNRFCCETLEDDAWGILQPAEILPTLETYATVSPERRQPFPGYCQGSSPSLQMAGWDISLINFMVPRADVSSKNGESSLFGVSLVFRCQSQCKLFDTSSKVPISQEEESALQKALEVIDKASVFKQKLVGSTRTEDAKPVSSEPVIGLALVSQRNVIPAMRATLSSLVRSFCSSNVSDGEGISHLVDILGNFDNEELEENVLSGILKPFVSLSSVPWKDLPIDAQRDAFTQFAGNQLIDSLPPIPLALLFVSALLEQKIVLSSSRRSILLSASTAIVELLKPMKWCHLFVPRVPAALATDLLQYPAPFIIGVPSEDPGMLDLIRDLPDDVTLVDLDVGRVILAASLSNNEEVGKNNFENKEDMTKALRLQILHLAQTLGSVIGRSLQPDLWLCDGVLQRPRIDSKAPRFDTLSQICNAFVSELVAGVSSCCFWIEESSPRHSELTEPTIVLDENRFFKVKEMRHSGLNFRIFSQHELDNETRHFALSVRDFDLILELFMRCQSMNEYIGNRPKSEMAFSF